LSKPANGGVLKMPNDVFPVSFYLSLTAVERISSMGLIR
jgi:hypothetical protein